MTDFEYDECPHCGQYLDEEYCHRCDYDLDLEDCNRCGETLTIDTWTGDDENHYCCSCYCKIQGGVN